MNATDGAEVLGLFLAEWDRAMSQVTTLTSSNSPFELGIQDPAQRYPVQQKVPRRAAAAVTPAPDTGAKKKARTKPGAMSTDPTPASKRKHEDDEAGGGPTKRQHINDMHAAIIQGDSRPERVIMDDVDGLLAMYHGLYSFMHLVLCTHPNRLLLRYTRTVFIDGFANAHREGKFTMLRLNDLYDKWFIILAMELRKDGAWRSAIRSVNQNRKENGIEPTDTVLVELFTQLGAHLQPQESTTPLDNSRLDALRTWIREYVQDPYMTDGISNAHVYTWSNMLEERDWVDQSERHMVMGMLKAYMDYVYNIDLNKKNVVMSDAYMFIKDFNYMYALRLFTQEDDVSGILYNALTELLGDIVVRLVQDLPVNLLQDAARKRKTEIQALIRAHPEQTDALLAEYAADEQALEQEHPGLPVYTHAGTLFRVMPIEFIIRVLLDHPELVTARYERGIKEMLVLRLGTEADTVYGPMKDRIRRIWKRIETVYYLNPTDFWSAWARVRHVSGRGPYEYQWSTIIPLVANEVSERDAHGMHGAYIASDPGTGKTLIALVILVLGNLLSGNKQPTLIVLPPALVDEWIDAWLTFFNVDAHAMFPLFLYERFGAISKVGNGELVHRVGDAVSSLPPNSILLVKRGQMEKFSAYKYTQDTVADPAKGIKARMATRRSIAQDPRANVLDLMQIAWQRVIVDEGHTFGNRETLAFEGLYNIIESSGVRPFVYILSGTPVVRDVIDLVSQLRLMGFKLRDRLDFSEERRKELEAAYDASLIMHKDGDDVGEALADAADAMDAIRKRVPSPDELLRLVDGPDDIKQEQEEEDADPDDAPDFMNVDMMDVPFYDRVGNMRAYIGNTRARSKLRQLVYQTEFDILFPLDNAYDPQSRRSLNKEKLFGYFYQLFVDDTPQYQRKNAPVEKDHEETHIPMGPGTLSQPQRALFDMLYPFMNIKGSRGYNLAKEVRRVSPYMLDTGNIQDDAPDTGMTGLDIADELFGRHVFYEQWKKQFIHTTLINTYSLEPQHSAPVWRLKSVGDKQLRKKQPVPQETAANEQMRIEQEQDKEREIEEQELERADAEEEDEEEAAPAAGARRGRGHGGKYANVRIKYDPAVKTEDNIYYINNGRGNLKGYAVDKALSYTPDDGETYPFYDIIMQLDYRFALHIRKTSLPLIHKHMSFQYIRDIQMVLGYDWRLINRVLYVHLIRAALRTAYAMRNDLTHEFMPIAGMKQPLYRMWYTLGIPRLLEIAQILLDNLDNVFPPQLYRSEQEESIAGMAADLKLATTESNGTITGFMPLNRDETYGPIIERIYMQLQDPALLDQTLTGQTVALIRQTLAENPTDKIIVYASNDDVLSYMGIMLSLHTLNSDQPIVPFKLRNRTRITDMNKEAMLKSYAAYVQGRTFYVHAKSAYANTESALISHFKAQPAVRVLFITFNKGGMGLNLQVANHEIFLTSTIRYTELRQARDRVYRNKQQKNVFIHHMLTHIPDIPIHHIWPPNEPMPSIVPFDGMGDYNWHSENNWWWYVLMHNLASSGATTAGGNLPDEWKARFTQCYEYVNNSHIMSAHQLVTEARKRWQHAHQQFYPIHQGMRSAATAEQNQDMHMRLALFRHRMMVLLQAE